MEFLNLPNEIIQHIFSFLDHMNRLIIRNVCRKLNELSACIQFVDRIWLRLSVVETNLTTLKHCFQKYRHVVIDCHGCEERMNELAEIFSDGNNVETLVLFGMQRVKATDLLILLQNVPNVRRLYLLTANFLLCCNMQQVCFSDLPNIEFLNKFYDDEWIDVFARGSKMVLPKVDDLMIFLPSKVNFDIESFQNKFPNLKQLQVTVNHPSILNLINSYKHQLNKIALCSIQVDSCTLFFDESFPELTHLYLGFTCPPDELDTEQCNNFFKNPVHARKLRELKLILINPSVLSTICSNCTSLLVLEVCTTNFDFLENISSLRNLKKLSIENYGPALLSHKFEHCSKFSKPIQTLKVVELIGSFGPTATLLKFINSTAPNLEVLTLEDVEYPEETLRIISETFPNLRHLELGYSDEPGQPPRLNFGYLETKINLVTLSLVNITVDNDGIQKWIKLAPNVSRIRITRCETLEDTHLMGFSTSSPKLKQLEFKDCAKITTQGLEEFRQKVPHVMVLLEK